MANLKKKLASNVEGDFFVDNTCINCDMCRQMAPENFIDVGQYSSVHAQPKDDNEIRQSMHALLTCPTGSIGYVGGQDVKEAMADFPMLLEDGVYHCGFTSPKSFGGKSYFVEHPEGNWLIDSPKFLPRLVKQMEAMGGRAKRLQALV